MKILSLLEQNAKLTVRQLALLTGMSEAEVESEIREYEKNGVICGYRTIVDWEKAGRESVRAVIRLKVTPQPGSGFEDAARRISEMPDVESVYLVSGRYDILLTMSARSLRDVAEFVSQRLSTIGTVIGTDTTFVLEKYKENNVNFMKENGSADDREVFS